MAGIEELAAGPFGLLYIDAFQSPTRRCDGVAILDCNDALTEDRFATAIEDLRPICLLW